MTLREAYSVPKHTSAICVQSFDDSLNSAIHITYRSWLRSSSMHEPRDPPLKVVIRVVVFNTAPSLSRTNRPNDIHSFGQIRLDSKWVIKNGELTRVAVRRQQTRLL